jgi:hypothetical protein
LGAGRSSAKAEGEFGKTLEEFLTRALLSAVPITSPDALASFLASYAREALAKIEPRSSLKELEDVRKTLEEALGLKFESDLATGKENNRGKHFFRSTLVQTLFYGLFSAWVLWSREPGRRKGDQFEWKSAVWSLQVPMIRALLERLVTPSHVRSLGLEELLSLTGEVLNRVDTAAFFQRFTWWSALTRFCAPSLAYPPALRTPTSTFLTRPAARARIWSKCWTASIERCKKSVAKMKSHFTISKMLPKSVSSVLKFCPPHTRSPIFSLECICSGPMPHS